MHRSGLILGAAALLMAIGCKSKESPATEPAKPSSNTKASKALLDVPRDTIYAASAHIRVIDAGAGQVVSGIDLQKSITAIVFTKDGLRGFVAASDGVRLFDTLKNEVRAQITKHPARTIALSSDETKLFVLEHEVIVAANGTRELTPFRLATVDVKTGDVLGSEEVGQRILTMLPSLDGKRAHLVVYGKGEVRLVQPGDKLSDGQKIDVMGDGQAVLGVRPYVVRSPDGHRAYVPLEGAASKVADIDLATGAVRFIEMGAPILMRGLGITPDGKTLVVNGSRLALKIDLASGKIAGRAELADSHIGVAISVDGRRAYLAQTIDGQGGAVTAVLLETMKVQGKIHIDDISPWVIAVRPRASFALAD